MIKLCFCMRRLPHLTREEFLEYWGRKHPRAGGPDAARILGMKKYAQVRALPEEVNKRVAASRPGVEPEFDGIAEVWVESLEAFLPMLGHKPKASVSDNIAKNNLRTVQRAGPDAIEAILDDIARDRDSAYAAAQAADAQR